MCPLLRDLGLLECCRDLGLLDCNRMEDVGVHNLAVVAPTAAAEATVAAADALVEETAGADTAAGKGEPGQP